MKLENYSPTFRNVLIQEVEISKTEGGIYIPSADFIKDKEYRVLKTGKDCIEIKTGDIVRVMTGIRLEEIDRKTFQVMEQQIIGYERAT